MSLAVALLLTLVLCCCLLVWGQQQARRELTEEKAAHAARRKAHRRSDTAHRKARVALAALVDEGAERERKLRSDLQSEKDHRRQDAVHFHADQEDQRRRHEGERQALRRMAAHYAERLEEIERDAFPATRPYVPTELPQEFAYFNERHRIEPVICEAGIDVSMHEVLARHRDATASGGCVSFTHVYRKLAEKIGRGLLENGGIRLEATPRYERDVVTVRGMVVAGKVGDGSHDLDAILRYR